jgi:hypothetical protein
MNPPVVGRTSRRRLIRRTITVLTRLYVAFFAGQVTDIGLSASLMGGTLLEYVADLEKEVADLRSRLERLEEGRAAS